MKKTIALLLTLIMATTLVACGQSSSAAPAATTTPAASAAPIASSAVPEPAKTYDLVFAATSSSSGYYALCVAFADVINSYVDNVTVTIMETGGTLDDFKYMRDGQASFAQVNSQYEYLLQNNLGALKDFGYTGSRDLVFFAPQMNYFVVNATSSIKGIEGLQGKKFNAGLAGSAGETDAMNILGANNITPDYFPASTADAIDALQNRQIVGLCKNASQLSPDSAIANVMTAIDIDILSFTPEQIAAVGAQYPWFTFETISGDIYGLDHDITSSSNHMGYSIDADIPDEIAYNIIKAIDEHQSEIKLAFPGIVDNVAEWTATKGKSLLHPGVVKYLQEKGYQIDPIRIPK